MNQHRIELTADRIVVHDRRRDLLPPTSLTVGTGELVVVSGDPGHGHTALALALSGRLALDGGSVAIDGDTSAALLREDVTPVDVPGVSAPDDAVPVRTIVGEELAMAGRKAGAKHVRSWLSAHGYLDLGDIRVDELSPTDRVAMMTGLAALRGGRFLVVTMPERHGGMPSGWLGSLLDLRSEDRGVLVTTSTEVAAHLPPDIRRYAIGAANQEKESA